MTSADLETLRAEILATAKGDYQRSLLVDGARWSGADLRGKARKWSGTYARSRAELVYRIEQVARAHGGSIRWECGTAQTGPRVLVVVVPAGEIRI